MKTNLLATALVLACASCTHYEPEPLDPVAEHGALATRGATRERPETVSSLPADLFPIAAEVDIDDGVTLAEANALALFYSPRLVAARGDLKLKGAELLRAGLLPNPELFLGPRLATEGGGLIFPASLSIEIPLDGRLDAEKGRAAAELEAARLLLLDREAEVLVSVRQRLVRIAGLRSRREILEALARASEQALTRTQELVRIREADQVALGLASLHRDEAGRDLRDTETALARSHVELLTFIGLLPDSRVRVEANEDLLTPVAVPETGDPSRMLEHTRLRALEASYKARERGVEGAIARQYPSLKIGPEFESDDGQASVGLGLSISLPIFDSNAGGIAVATERRARGREAWRAALVDLAARESLARMNLQAARSLLDVLRTRTLPAAESAEQALEARLRIGQTTLVEVLATRGAIARARLRDVELTQEVATRSLEALWYAGLLLAPPKPDHRDGGEER
ncbi:MAG: hypothetical protein CMJ83_21905 [Planctomycetes bacterium]|nr:hypothetical protein [Planctomycetota bacterium]